MRVVLFLAAIAAFLFSMHLWDAGFVARFHHGKKGGARLLQCRPDGRRQSLVSVPRSNGPAHRPRSEVRPAVPATRREATDWFCPVVSQTAVHGQLGADWF